MPPAQDGFWIIHFNDEAIGEVKGLEQAISVVDRLKKKHPDDVIFHATNSTSSRNFTGNDRIFELLQGKFRANSIARPTS